jgi:predicted cupin superfamily sugar epimerase
MTAESIIDRLALEPHPEGGWYRETWRDATPPRGAGSAIYFLLRAGEVSHWHRVDAVEVWHHYLGASIDHSMMYERELVTAALGTDLAAGEVPQLVVPADTWQSARSRGEWTLVGCTVAPAFTFDGFELAPPDLKPGW